MDNIQVLHLPHQHEITAIRRQGNHRPRGFLDLKIRPAFKFLDLPITKIFIVTVDRDPGLGKNWANDQDFNPQKQQEKFFPQ